jgi:hypothetical protein
MYWCITYILLYIQNCFNKVTNEDNPTHDVVLQVDEAPFIGCVIDCKAFSLLHEVPVVLVLAMKSVFGSILNDSHIAKTLHVVKRKFPFVIAPHVLEFIKGKG